MTRSTGRAPVYGADGELGMTRPETAHRAVAAWSAGEVITSREVAEHYVGLVCFKIGPPRLVGVELEWLVHDALDPTVPVTAEQLAAALGEWGPRHLRPDHPDAAPHAPHSRSEHHSNAHQSNAHQHSANQHSAQPGSRPQQSKLLPRGSAVTVEPGGQVEISSRPAASLAECLTDAALDSDTLRTALARAGLVVSGHGIDPHRTPSRVLDLPRYAAMEAYFDRTGDAGRTMMCPTAAVQVSLDAGTESDTAADGLTARWQALHTLGPTLVAMFANSPVHAGAATGWRSTRQGAWAGIDAARTAPPGNGGGAADPRLVYAR